MAEPVTPDEIRLRVDKTEEAVQVLVDIINRVLTMDDSVALLLHGKAVEVFDSSNFSLWKAGHAEAVERFKSKGWLVAYKDSAKFGRVYYFQLPL